MALAKLGKFWLKPYGFLNPFPSAKADDNEKDGNKADGNNADNDL